MKECWEEAGVPGELAAAAAPVGFVSYVSMSDEGLKPDVLFCYDLQLPADFVPIPQDGEVGVLTAAHFQPGAPGEHGVLLTSNTQCWGWLRVVGIYLL